MKGRMLAVVGLILAGWLWWTGGGAGSRDAAADEQRSIRSGRLTRESEGEMERLDFKSSIRGEKGPAATHSPYQLKDFHLPPVAIEGLTLSAALEKLRGVYQEACAVSGEVPLNLRFTVPPGGDRVLNLKLAAGTMDSVIRLLGANGGLKVSRHELEYRFEIPADPQGIAEGKLAVPPDFLLRLAGVVLDSFTRLNFNPADGTLEYESRSGADIETLKGLARQMSETPLQEKLETRILELAPGIEWDAEIGQLDAAGVEALMREMVQREGVDLLTMPSVTARNGETANVEVVREVIYPVAGSDTEFESRNVGVEMEIRPTMLGFGHRMEVNFAETRVLEVRDAGPEFHERSRIESSTYAGDQSTRLLEQVRPDGSRVVMLITPSTVDATGRLVARGR